MARQLRLPFTLRKRTNESDILWIDLICCVVFTITLRSDADC